jgi:hypothetical protein
MGGVMTGRIVESDSGSRRVRKSVDACLYILEICEEACRVEEELRDEMEEESSWDDESVSRVGARVVAMEPLEVMVRCEFADKNWRKEKKRRCQQSAGMQLVIRECESHGLGRC